jgi:uncharacterized protein (TIGR03067 family)
VIKSRGAGLDAGILMTKRAVLFVVWAAWSVAAVADEAKTDRETIQGKWAIASLTVNGEVRSADTFKDLRLEIKGDKYIITQEGEAAFRTFKLDPTRKPKAIDITYGDGPNKGKTGRAIYSVEPDTLRICRDEQPERERPKEFRAERGSGRVLVTWKRVK